MVTTSWACGPDAVAPPDLPSPQRAEHARLPPSSHPLPKPNCICKGTRRRGRSRQRRVRQQRISCERRSATHTHIHSQTYVAHTDSTHGCTVVDTAVSHRHGHEPPPPNDFFANFLPTLLFALLWLSLSLTLSFSRAVPVCSPHTYTHMHTWSLKQRSRSTCLSRLVTRLGLGGGC